MTDHETDAPETVYEAPASLYIHIDNETGKCLDISIVPAEGDAGYFGHRLHDSIWAAVSDHLESVRTNPESLHEDASFAIRWEG